MPTSYSAGVVNFATGGEPSPMPSTPALVPVVITSEPGVDQAAAPVPTTPETIEIEVAGDYRMRVGSGFDGCALKRVPDVLRSDDPGTFGRSRVAGGRARRQAARHEGAGTAGSGDARARFLRRRSVRLSQGSGATCSRSSGMTAWTCRSRRNPVHTFRPQRAG